LVRLGSNFLKDVVASGWNTAHVILFRSRGLRPGFVHLSFGDLPDSAANFLGALISLTPGTTTIDIDLDRREFLLHLLDLDRSESVLAGIHRDFLEPMRILSGVRP
jgi:multicomponent K+:H+ antiporter subunit E/multicomponent Na+:H+ antiporter subunit E